ncbi:MAG: hypothetical protein QM520_00475 [Gammaproteobacteria bacterium]|nr:hypothetical protein [Gammaproteobacteria bacterium]
MSTFNLQEALSQLSNPSQYNSIQALYDLAKQVNVDASGSVTILFSGESTAYNTDGQLIISNRQLLEGMKRSGVSIREIGDTDVAKFLDSPEFKQALARQYNLDERDLNTKLADLSPDKQVALKSMNDALYHPTNGPWAKASDRFVEATKGEVRTLTGGAMAGRVFEQTELPQALNNTKITTIDGIPRGDLQARGVGDAFDAIRAQSDVLTSHIKVVTNSQGDIVLGAHGPLIDTRAYFAQTGLSGVDHLPPVEGSAYRHLGEYIPNRLTSHAHGAAILQGIIDHYQAQAHTLDLPGQDNAALRAGARSALNKLGWAGDLLALGLATTAANAAYERGDITEGNKIMQGWVIDFTGGLAGGLLAAKLMASALTPLYLTGPAGGIVAGALTFFASFVGSIAGSLGFGELLDTFSSKTSAAGLAGTTPPGHDPLALDLDGDGIETTSTRDGTVILFDQNADGVKTGTGWVKSDDGWLVLDRNGTIDSGRELFGVDTLKSNGQLATDGFDALKDLDANQDGKIDAADSVFASLRIWRDLNQDGTSQAEELTTLSAHHIVSIGVNSRAVRTNLGNGNVLTADATFTRTDGSIGTTATTQGMLANLELLLNPFYRSFTHQITLTNQAKALPNLRGSGRVRDLGEAISLSTDLGNWVQTYIESTTRQGQIDQLDGFIDRWADTADMKPLKAQATALSASGVSLTYNLAGMAAGTPTYDDFVRKLGVVERFMGFTYGGAQGQARFTPLNATSGNLTVSLAT